MLLKHMAHVEMETQEQDGTSKSKQFKVRRMKFDGNRLSMLLEDDSTDQSEKPPEVYLKLSSSMAVQVLQSVMLYGSRAALRLEELGVDITGPEPANSN